MESTPPADCFGFLTVRRNETIGYFGGLLTVNPLGRPLEFHCSLPLKPSRAQTILYGPSLEDFLVGEQIALAIASKVRLRPVAILCDVAAALSLRNVLNLPIACVLDVAASESDRGGDALLRPGHRPSRSLHSFDVDRCQLGVLPEYEADAGHISREWKRCNPQVHLHEPFTRIAEALLEANPAARAA